MKRLFPSTFIHPVVIFGILLATVLLSPQQASAQLPELKKGDLVRVWSSRFSGGNVIGTIELKRPQSLVLYNSDSTLTISHASIERLDLAIGEKRQTLKGFLIGAGSGAFLGGTIGLISYSPCTSEEFLGCLLEPNSRGEAAGLGAIIGGLSLGLVGLIVGSQSTKTRWQKIVFPPQPSISLRAVRIQNIGYSPGVVITWSL